ncbi:hypothetical protein A4H97_25405 [Niastella yeongjuensis]|uniref:Iron dicitrate transport regulator FecR n=1 Tax=Niastella yeongjuensis TaxID=354355 RepID=A0A1V9F2T5_9BACT|nr:FecR family protein [Niastella yeongjuensis]OQP52659.1 hypothetical protein A4H97_25405 [Niastella yeongjuensis]SEP32959.1 FecR family protein [Niastella yeongjuensis]
MQSEEARLKYLFQRYFNKTASQDERKELADLISDDHNKNRFMQLMSETWEHYQNDGDWITASASDAMLKHILAKEETSEVPVKRIAWPRLAAAAAVLIIIAGAAWFIINNNKKETPAAIQELAQDAAPGSYKAQLTLADGSHITLDSAALGQLAKQGNTTVINKAGELLYKPEGGDQSIIYNTITTNRGETYSFSLADGSKVWLNSASTVRFPVAFTGADRRIEITGEVFVKVAKDKTHPFIVSASGMEVKALGTEFNVNAYGDEGGVSATLVEGSVSVGRRPAYAKASAGEAEGREEKAKEEDQSVILKPGEQVSVTQSSQLSQPVQVQIEEVIGWKDGFFHFESAELPAILRQFARWYDIEVVYEGPVTKRKFFTIVQRSSTLKNVLALLQDNNINYKIEGKKLIVSQ